jgi:hypothetical protein
MIVRWVGFLFRVAARVVHPPRHASLGRVGDEIERLEQRRAQRRVTSR